MKSPNPHVITRTFPIHVCTYEVTFIILLSVRKIRLREIKPVVPNYTQSVAELAFKLCLPDAEVHP